MSSELRDSPPDELEVTAYDRAHARLYLRLLDAEASGAHWKAVARLLFNRDPEAEPARTQAMYETHLARARWMRDAVIALVEDGSHMITGNYLRLLRRRRPTRPTS